MTSDLQTWALPRLQRLLPIDDDSLKEIIAYSCFLSKEAGAEHLKNLLGDSPQALEFISSFNSRRTEVATPKRTESPAAPTSSYDGVPRGQRGQKKARAPLHSAGPVRQPAGYGDVSGGYHKPLLDTGNSGPSSKTTTTPSTKSLSNALSLNSTPDALQLPERTIGGLSSNTTSRDPSPRKLPPSASGSLISDLPNVRSKQSKKPSHASQYQSQPHSGTSTPTRSHPTSKTTTTSNISDLTSAIAQLELATNPTISTTERRKCDCSGTLHPIFTTAPNCLNCGKIICALEGLQPCSFCDSPILTKDQVTSMINALKQERGAERQAVHNNSSAPRPASSGSGYSTPISISGAHTPDSSYGNSGDEANASAAAQRARAHRDKLLSYQRENAQRTRVHDEAADYDAILTPGATQWMSPVQRAAALKKQQKYMREQEEAGRPEWERKRTVLSVGFNKEGKLVRTYNKMDTKSAGGERRSDDVGEDESDGVDDGEGEGGGDQQNLSSKTSKGAFSNNPLLKSGKLVRPIWKPSDTAGKGKETVAVGEGTMMDQQQSKRERKSVWRRVQDDDDGEANNEKWILDGGLHGFEVESRMLEDGSQVESG